MTTDEAAVRELLAGVVADDDTRIAREWVGHQVEHGFPRSQAGERELLVEAAGLLQVLREALASEHAAEQLAHRHAPLHEAVVRMSAQRARNASTPSGTAMSILALKDVLLDAVRRRDDDPGVLLATALLVNRLLDAAGVLTFQSYVEGREDIIRAQHRQMLELSTPVVLLWHQVLAVPLIGTLDSTRTQVVMNSLLEGIQDNEARVAIIDITGVSTVDTVVAQHLMQTVAAVRLMGAECLISGIRPTIAQTITQLGIDLSTIITRSTLADALVEAIRLIGDVRGRELLREKVSR
ncbi:STAS domain-containing protein [Actinokineospora sp. 24-640]